VTVRTGRKPGHTVLTREEIWFLSPTIESKVSVFLVVVVSLCCDVCITQFEGVGDELCLLFIAFLTTQMLTYNEDFWIGMNDVNWEMHFVWTDGKGISYTNWAKGHPTTLPQGRFAFMDEVISTPKHYPNNFVSVFEFNKVMVLCFSHKN